MESSLLVACSGPVHRWKKKTKFRSFEVLITHFCLASYQDSVQEEKRSAQPGKNQVLKNEVCLDKLD